MNLIYFCIQLPTKNFDTMQEQKTTDSSQIFKEWLVGNIDRFKYKPTLVKTDID